MWENYKIHNLFLESAQLFIVSDPHLSALSKLKFQYSSTWWESICLDEPGIYILTGGRQIGKSTSCKLLIKHCLQKDKLAPENILYLPCDEIFDSKELSIHCRNFLNSQNTSFLLVIDEITYVKNWERVIKSLADEGLFTKGLCILTGSDSIILKEAAMSFPGRRGNANQVDFHLYPLTFKEYVNLVAPKRKLAIEELADYFQNYLISGGYLRAINDFEKNKQLSPSTFLTYEQWIRGDFLKQGKNENFLCLILQALLQLGVSPISYSALTQKIGLMSKETCIDYINILERMDILIHLQAFDQNKLQGFPRKDRKFHFFDPFIYRTIHQWIQRELGLPEMMIEPTLVEACVASHCHRLGKTFYFKGQGEVDVIRLRKNKYQAIEVKWSNQIRSNDLKMLRHFQNSIILNKTCQTGSIDNIQLVPLYQFLYEECGES